MLAADERAQLHCLSRRDASSPVVLPLGHALSIPTALEQRLGFPPESASVEHLFPAGLEHACHLPHHQPSKHNGTHRQPSYAQAARRVLSHCNNAGIGTAICTRDSSSCRQQ